MESVLYIRLYTILVKHSKSLTKARAREIMMQKTGLINGGKNKTLYANSKFLEPLLDSSRRSGKKPKHDQ